MYPWTVSLMYLIHIFILALLNTESINLNPLSIRLLLVTYLIISGSAIVIVNLGDLCF